MKKTRVCLVAFKYFPEWAGVARSASRLVKYLMEAGMEVHVVVAPGDQPIYPQADNFIETINNPGFDEHGSLVYRPKIAQEEVMGGMLEFLKLLDARYHFDIFHGYWLPLAFPCLMIAQKNRPVIGSIRGNDAFKEGVLPQSLPYVSSVLNHASWITSVCSDLLDGVGAISSISGRSSVILNGIDSTGFPMWKGGDATRGVVGSSGEFRFKKAIPDLIEAYSLVPRELRKTLMLCGPFSDENQERISQEKINTLLLESEVRITGYLERTALLNEITNFNVFVINSYHDGLPNTLLEAASCGIPIVATKTGGMLDVLVDNENALLVDPGDIAAMARAITRVLTDVDLARKLSAGSYHLKKLMSFEHEKSEWLFLYKTLLERPTIKSISDLIEV
ncbi:hypothetical protein CBP51_05035 [Cellvibrio mixtus]|uniref:Glycosyl transferase family 1 n=1 Tax=Cellvibrio mixtus TaxID=39650 RepID=A0A266Q942_9GAMM|nr:glycosyltransferase family 4 protein [Cellvibrio mixtus]OZY86394.1 hypothetical protein CBP51_05035 [Cellvibrio mixtus]